jgi:hypothetical protein
VRTLKLGATDSPKHNASLPLLNPLNTHSYPYATTPSFSQTPALLSLSLSWNTIMMMVIEKPFILLLLGFVLMMLAQSSTTSFTDLSALITFNLKISSRPNATVLAGTGPQLQASAIGLGSHAADAGKESPA